jgi:hypothetical protein
MQDEFMNFVVFLDHFPRQRLQKYIVLITPDNASVCNLLDLEDAPVAYRLHPLLDRSNYGMGAERYPKSNEGKCILDPLEAQPNHQNFKMHQLKDLFIKFYDPIPKRKDTIALLNFKFY